MLVQANCLFNFVTTLVLLELTEAGSIAILIKVALSNNRETVSFKNKRLEENI